MFPPPPGCDPDYLGRQVPLLPPHLHHPVGPRGQGTAEGRRGGLGRGGDLQWAVEGRERDCMKGVHTMQDNLHKATSIVCG